MRSPEPTSALASFSADQVAPPLAATSFAEVLDELALFAVRQPGVNDGERLLRQVAAIGADHTLLLGRGAILSHLRSDTTDRVVVVLGIADRSIRVPAETSGETRGRLFVLVVAPVGDAAGYIEMVATWAAALREEGVVEEILATESNQEIAALRAIREAPRVRRLSVIDVMDPASQRIYPDMPLREAARLLARSGYTALPVVNRNDEVVGTVSERTAIEDLLPGYLRVFENETDADERSELSVRDVMSKAVLCIPIEASISDAASIIVNKDVNPVPVTRDGKWVGLVSRRSLIRKLLQF